ncbi:MAG TPA: histidine kinase [Chitinophagaceae bacterium]|nr:histidine kinase [Chitinophagaceae bacterium]
MFWFILAIYFALLQAANPFLKPSSSYVNNLPSAFIRSLLLLVPQVFAAYTILHLVVPMYIRKRQVLLAFLCLTIIWILSATINIQMSKNINPFVLKWVLPGNYYRYFDALPNHGIIIELLSVTKGVFTGAGFLVMLRYIKQWYVKDQRNLQLQKENAQSQLQLLTAQVHPHFLFNTLNNIYSQTQTESPRGSKMIMELSGMLRYILAEGSKSLVPLQKELDMVQEYMNLEKIKYGNNLDVSMTLPNATHDLQITPLLLLPFAENCFKHVDGSDQVNNWINLEISIHEKQLYMKLMNGKNSGYEGNGLQPVMGLANVKKRLELLYPGKHELKVTDEREVLIIDLLIMLTDNNPGSGIRDEQPGSITVEYA